MIQELLGGAVEEKKISIPRSLLVDTSSSSNSSSSISSTSLSASSSPSTTSEPQQNLRCPRCDSSNTKFCYYNNYNLTQPRHFCKTCRRYWTKGGALRNIPVGGGTRKNSKRSSASATSGATASKRPSTTSPPPPPSDQLTKPQPISVLYPLQTDSDDRLLDITGSFSSLLASSGGFGNLLEGFGSGASSGVAGVLPNSGDLNRSMGGRVDQLRSSSDGNSNENPVALENFMGDSSCWANGWPDLRIYTPGSGFQ